MPKIIDRMIGMLRKKKPAKTVQHYTLPIIENGEYVGCFMIKNDDAVDKAARQKKKP